MLSKLNLLHLMLLAPLAFAAPGKKEDSSPTTEATASATLGSDSSSTSATGSPSISKSGSSSSADGPTTFPFDNLQLQLPSDKQHEGRPDTIPGSQLATYSNPEYYEVKDGVVIMIVPGSPESTKCVTTPNSKHCRTEFQEIKPKSWDPTAASNSMTASVMVVSADDSEHGTCIGQIHILESVSVRPVMELFYNKEGVLSVGVEKTRAGGNEVVTELTTKGIKAIPLGTKFTYTITYQQSKLSVSINGQSVDFTDAAKGLDNPASYFKAGNYNQGDGKSEIHFFGLEIDHES